MPASVIMIHFQNEKLEVADLWFAISDSLFDAKVYAGRGFLVSEYHHASAGNNYQIRVINMLTERLLSFAARLDATHLLAYLDPVTQLPNSLAAERELHKTLQQTASARGTFSILFIDGDNLRRYNDISYSAGDEMLRRLSNVLAHHLRPGDFLARWRVGDEFLVVLPESPLEKAKYVAERLRSAVQAESAKWEIPVTVSIGVSTFPIHGESTDQLLDSVERVAKLAKDYGKNQVVAP
jgi:diguanylate cyclase (GGDEF)-like protein